MFCLEDYYCQRNRDGIRDKDGLLITLIEQNERKIFPKLLWNSKSWNNWYVYYCRQNVFTTTVKNKINFFVADFTLNIEKGVKNRDWQMAVRGNNNVKFGVNRFVYSSSEEVLSSSEVDTRYKCHWILSSLIRDWFYLPYWQKLKPGIVWHIFGNNSLLMSIFGWYLQLIHTLYYIQLINSVHQGAEISQYRSSVKVN